MLTIGLGAMRQLAARLLAAQPAMARTATEFAAGFETIITAREDGGAIVGCA